VEAAVHVEVTIFNLKYLRVQAKSNKRPREVEPRTIPFSTKRIDREAFNDLLFSKTARLFTQRLPSIEVPELGVTYRVDWSHSDKHSSFKGL
jgi:hypothetical protein